VSGNNGTSANYLEILKKRAKESRVYRNYQLVGLEIADILKDRPHKALYIKLAKNGNAESLLRLAKEVGERRGIKKPGAYFMKLLSLASPQGGLVSPKVVVKPTLKKKRSSKKKNGSR